MTRLDSVEMDSMENYIIDARGISASYGKHVVLREVGLRVKPGEIVGVCGHNGAGKTTLLKSLFRIHEIDEGTITFKGESITDSNATKMAASGMSFTPSEKPLFRDLTVMENLLLGAHTVKDRTVIGQRVEEVIDIFPILRERLAQFAGRLSGGQQRQLSLGMALMVQPSLMLLDEPSLGISPTVVTKTFETIRDLARQRGMSVLIIEQNVKAMVSIADRVYVLRHGEIVLEESGDEARARTDWWQLF